MSDRPTGLDPKSEKCVATWTAAISDLREDTSFIYPNEEPLVFERQTIRQIVHASVGGPAVRLRFSNEYGDADVQVEAVRIATAAGGSEIDAASDVAVTFDGNAMLTIPAGGAVWSDLVPFTVSDLGDVAITLYVDRPTPAQTVHRIALQDTFVAKGDHRSAARMPEEGTEVRGSWYWLSEMAVSCDAAGDVVVIIGDSNSEGDGSTPGRNLRYPDQLSRQFSGRARPVSVVNQGLGGNRLLHDIFGPSCLNRFRRDVLSVTGVTTVILMIGGNDIGFALGGGDYLPHQKVTSDLMIAALKDLTAAAHAENVRIFLGTILPFGGSGHSSPAGEEVRSAVNAWIRSVDGIDAVVDFEEGLRDAADETKIAPIYDFGDHVHPNDAGNARMAEVAYRALVAAGY